MKMSFCYKLLFILILIPTISQSQSEYPDSLIVITPPSEKILSRIGVFGDINYIHHSSSFQNIPGIGNCCPQFENGTGFGFIIGGVFEFELSSLFRLNLSPYFDYMSGEHLYNEAKQMGINGEEYDGVIEHSIMTENISVGLQPSIDVRIYQDLFFRAGVDINYSLNATFEQAERLIKPEKVGTFENGKRIRNEHSGDIPEHNDLKLGLLFGAYYDFPINTNKTQFISPEIKYVYGLDPMIKDYEWYLHKFSIGAAYKFVLPDNLPDTTFLSDLSLLGIMIDKNDVVQEITGFSVSDYFECGEYSSKEISINKFMFEPKLSTRSDIKQFRFTVSQNDSVIKEVKTENSIPESVEWIVEDDLDKILYNAQPLNFAVSVTTEDNVMTSNIISANPTRRKFDIRTDVFVKAFDDSENLVEFNKIEFQETKSTNMRPFLNYVFFDKNSGRIPPRYKRITKEETNDFKIEQLGDLGALETYYNLLNILGMRLRDYPDANIILTGCNSDYGAEKQNKALSVSRAFSIKRYLNRVWDISYDRIKIIGRNLPKTASRTSEKEHYDKVREENRRVEIAADDWRVLSPVVTFDTLRNISPKNIRFEYDAESDLPLKSSDFIIQIDGNDVSRRMDNALDMNSLYFDIELNRSEFTKRNGELQYSFKAVNDKEKSCFSEGVIPYEAQIQDTTHDKYSLILFDFNSDKLSEQNTRIANYINDRIAKDANGNILGKVTVIGSTDNIGSIEYNQKLSKRRVDAVVNFLDLNKKNVQFSGMGEDVLTHPVELPEGRLYCRTVTIIVKNPNDWKPE